MAFTTPEQTSIEDQLIAANPSCVATDLGDEKIILHVNAGVYYGLNEVGALVWELVQEPKNFITILQAVVAEYEVDPHRCAQDLQGLLLELAEQDLISLTPAQTG